MVGEERVATLDGTQVIVRLLTPSDAAQLMAMHERLSAYSIYNRYLQHRRPSPAEIEAMCATAPGLGAGLVVTPVSSPAEIVGMAYYRIAPGAHPRIAEPAILIEDRYQRRGIGRLLWHRLNQMAQRAGVDAFLVYIHPDNRPMMQLIRAVARPQSYTPIFNGSEIEVQVDLRQFAQAA